MHLYHASVYASNFGRLSNLYARLDEKERGWYDGMENVLESYHYVSNPRYRDNIRRDGRKVFLDSGAFSAMMLGVTVDLGRYCDYIHENGDIIVEASVLDAIGDADGTWRNQMEMERRGVKPLPCYHYGEPPEVLDWYVSRYPYVTIGGMVPISTDQLRVWLDRLWEEQLTDADGRPKLKVHGFGLTSRELMVRYPWYSVDSSSWQAAATNGWIMMPRRFVGYISVSKNASQRKVAGQHLDTFAPAERAAVVAEIEDLGGDVGRLQDSYLARRCWNIWALPKLAKTDGHCETFRAREQRLF